MLRASCSEANRRTLYRIAQGRKGVRSGAILARAMAARPRQGFVLAIRWPPGYHRTRHATTRNRQAKGRAVIANLHEGSRSSGNAGISGSGSGL